jgi:hypothetical protein
VSIKFVAAIARIWWSWNDRRGADTRELSNNIAVFMPASIRTVIPGSTQPSTGGTLASLIQCLLLPAETGKIRIWGT